MPEVGGGGLAHRSKPRSIGVRAAKATFSTLLDEAAAGHHALICRRSRPVAALISLNDLDLLGELIRRDEELAAVMRARGHDVDPWVTPTILRVVVSYLAPPDATGASHDATSPAEGSRLGSTSWT
jgi:prevent-host-death family protein